MGCTNLNTDILLNIEKILIADPGHTKFKKKIQGFHLKKSAILSEI